MIPDAFIDGLTGRLWLAQVHSLVAGVTIAIWLRHVRLPPGRTRQLMLGVLLCVPLLTALTPGRLDSTFRDEHAWFDSARVLALPLFGALRVYHIALGLAALTTAVTLWQEVLPVLRQRRPQQEPAPPPLAQLVASQPGGASIELGVTTEPGIVVSLFGHPGKHHLRLSRGAIAALDDHELGAVVRHELAHAEPRRWLVTHGLFAARFLQFFNPVAMLAFREWLVGQEVECDSRAAGDRRRVLASALLKVYAATTPRDVAARATLRRRVDLLLDDVPDRDGVPASMALVATALLVILLSRIV